jgi:1-acyl-sn-glycerol-3-phosphate acyltransferase
MNVNKAESVLSLLATWRGTLLASFVGGVALLLTRAFADPRATRGIMRWWSKRVIQSLGIKVSLPGKRQISGPCVVVVNHASLLDVPVLGAVLHGDLHWVAKRSLFFVPLIGWYLWLCGSVPIARSQRGNFRRLEQAAARIFADGGSLIVFPEGTRSPDGSLLEFRGGAFALAVDLGVPIVPVVIGGSGALLKKGSLHVAPGYPKHVEVRVLGVLRDSMTGDRQTRIATLQRETRGQMARALAELQRTHGRQRAMRPNNR